ncbi:MAG: peptide chain release factor 1 [Elusimicrobia bacterium RIFOXYA2_FULL_50_26]|nr:MAG: peptide chain release factor 1 [Elusimicrobia bacterium RIFOXYA2_FULL_50_26]
MIEKKFDALEQRYIELEKLLSDPSVIAQTDNYRKYSREHAGLSQVISRYREYRRVAEELKTLEELKNSEDSEMRTMASAESDGLLEKKERLTDELRLSLIVPDPNDSKDIIIEIRAGTGGEEAALFAGDLFRMYCRYAESKNWKVELIDSNPTGLGGFKEVIFGVAGANVWRHFKFERGTHRVQRVPETEASGRVHTSAVTVAVLPEAEEVEVGIRPDDLRIDTYRSSGAGGQHVNKTESAIRITHLPTNIVVACQDERSQIKNRAKAMKLLLAKILELRQKEQEQAIMSDRRQQVGSGDRSEKIRTYNFPQNRITDHRINYSLHRLKEVLEGDLEELVNALVKDEQQRKLAE